MFIKNISGGSLTIDTWYGSATVANNGYVAILPEFFWQIEERFNTDWRLATAGEIGAGWDVALTNWRIFVGNASNVAVWVAVSGDAAISNTWAVTVSDLTITWQATGDILYFDGTNWVKLAIGTVGQVLTVSAGWLPEWAT